MPSADHLFRPTSPAPAAPALGAVDGEPESSPEPAEKKPSGRVRHDEKMTVYVTSDELLDVEHTRLMLRRSHGLAVDRGRLVREALAIALADFEANGADSLIVQQLSDS